MGGARSRNPHVQKTKCFIPEFLLDKETVRVNWEGVAEGRHR